MSAIDNIRLSNHPRGLIYLLAVDIWERFSFYGFRALLVLYMSIQLMYSDEKSYATYAVFVALAYGLQILGGLIADHLLGLKKTILFGAVLILVGHICLSLSSIFDWFFMGLAFVALGTGLFKPNVNTLMGSLYRKDDPLRDSGFTLLYMAINLGAFVAPLACGFIGYRYGWHYGFGIAALGMLMGLIIFTRGFRFFAEYGLPPEKIDLQQNISLGITREQMLYLSLFLAVPLLSKLIIFYKYFDLLMPLFAVLVLIFFAKLIITHTGNERKALFGVFVLMLFQTAFFALTEQSGANITLFTDRYIDHEIFGANLTTAQYQSLDPFFILIFGPILAMLWGSLAKKSKDISAPVKFLAGMMAVGFGFVLLLLAMKYTETYSISSAWIIATYFLFAVGELLIMPIGFSLVTKLVPEKIIGTVMGFWMFSLAFAQYVAGVLSRISAVDDFSTSFSMSIGVAIIMIVVLAGLIKIPGWKSLFIVS